MNPGGPSLGCQDLMGVQDLSDPPYSDGHIRQGYDCTEGWHSTIANPK